MNHRSQIFTRNRLQDPLFSRGEVFAVFPARDWPPRLPTDWTHLSKYKHAVCNLSGITSSTSSFSSSSTTTHFPSSHCSVRSTAFTYFFSPLLLLLWGCLSLSIFPPCFSICQSQQLWCWIINSKPEAPPITPGRGRRAGVRSRMEERGSWTAVKNRPHIFKNVFNLLLCNGAIYLMYITRVLIQICLYFLRFF